MIEILELAASVIYLGGRLIHSPFQACLSMILLEKI